ncbi:MAG: hypothetical protein A2X12_11715 [Bacteroidetes bacterium GWE2_29_8]|nr:MAG: hypothetical protein A2X12_11715 [Bacteroidetes bacterium GWE2_29_8]OFY20463.1 MAG: hypothetical protein A2X02_02390 [Bacteroidetes bacterium GWF2_29_10]
MSIIDKIVKKLNMSPHPEGGYYVETYRSEINVDNIYANAKYGDSRKIATCIYYLLTNNDVSKFHKLKSDEFWFYHTGSSAMVYIINKDGILEKRKLGNDILHNESPQILIEAGNIFGAEVIDKKSFILLSCIVVPGFDFNDFELVNRIELLHKYPKYNDLIYRLS